MQDCSLSIRLLMEFIRLSNRVIKNNPIPKKVRILLIYHPITTIIINLISSFNNLYLKHLMIKPERLVK